MKVLQKLLLAFSLLSIFATTAYAQTKLAVINQAGEVWARDLTTTSVGPGGKLMGPSLFGGPNDRFVFGSTNDIAVVNNSGELWTHQVDDTSISGGFNVPGGLFGGPDTKYVVYDGFMTIYVVNTNGEVWAHYWNHGYPSLSGGTNLNGPSLFGGANDKYVLFDGYNGPSGDNGAGRILVINTLGQVWAHDLLCSNPNPNSLFCVPDTVGGGYLVGGPGLFGAPNDKYVVLHNNLLMVINTYGQVWARNITHSAVGGGYLLTGPGLFGGPNDKYVVVYDIVPPPPLQ